MELKVRYLKDIEELEKTSKGDWIDLRAAEDATMAAGEYKVIPLGVAIQLPEGYEAIMAPRSSMFKHWGIVPANAIGVIDNNFCGDNDEWGFLTLATRDTVIRKNDRICQFRVLLNQSEIEFDVVESLGNKDRGGIGSTGKR